MRSAQQEAAERIGGRYDVRVLEPSPPGVDEPPFFADDPVAGGDVAPVARAGCAHLGRRLRRGRRPRAAGVVRGPLARPPVPPTAAGRLHGHPSRPPHPGRAGGGAGPARGQRQDRPALHLPRLRDAVLRRPPGPGGGRRAARRTVERRRLTPATLRQAAEFVGVPVGAETGVYTPTTPDDPDAPLAIDPAAARAVGDWFGFCASILEQLRADADADADSPSRLQLWPEHFDLAVDLGPDGARANFGGSPGDDRPPRALPLHRAVGAPRGRLLERALRRLPVLRRHPRRRRPPRVPPARKGAVAAMSETAWVKVDADGLEEGRVTTVVAAGRAICLTRTAAGYGALDNHCPHQGGPLGDGQIADGYVICPWHAYEYDPASGKPPPGFSDGATAYAVDQRADGLYVELPVHEDTRLAHGPDGRRAVPVGPRHRVRHGRALQPGPGRRPAQGRGGRPHRLRRHPPRGGRRLRGVGLRQGLRASRPPASPSPGRAPPTCSPACGTPRSTGCRSSPSPAR